MISDLVLESPSAMCESMLYIGDNFCLIYSKFSANNGIYFPIYSHTLFMYFMNFLNIAYSDSILNNSVLAQNKKGSLFFHFSIVVFTYMSNNKSHRFTSGL